MKHLLKITALTLAFAAIVLAGCEDGEDDNSDSMLLMLLGGGGTATAYKETYTADGVTFKMAYVPGGKTFPTGINDEGSATVANAFWIGETEATYELCYKVFVWATTDAGSGTRADGGVLYTAVFDPVNPPRAGSSGYEADSQEPVTFLNWRHAMVWCNALTEWYNAHKGTGYACVYYTDSGYTTPLRSVNDTGSVNSTPGSQDNPYVKPDAKGFRLITNNEWELAARYTDVTAWLYGDHVSGDQSGYCHNDGSPLGGQPLSTVFGDYAVFIGNSGASTAAVKSKTANALGLYDMSGNVWEWCFDWYPGLEGSCRVLRGGGWASEPDNLRVGLAADEGYPYLEAEIIGFRFARSAE